MWGAVLDLDQPFGEIQQAEQVAEQSEPVMTCGMCMLEQVALTSSLTAAAVPFACWYNTNIKHSADSLSQELLHQEVGAAADNTRAALEYKGHLFNSGQQYLCCAMLQRKCRSQQ
jgi:hypothetical protein